MQKLKFALILTLTFCVAANAFPDAIAAPRINTSQVAPNTKEKPVVAQELSTDTNAPQTVTNRVKTETTIATTGSETATPVSPKDNTTTTKAPELITNATTTSSTTAPPTTTTIPSTAKTTTKPTTTSTTTAAVPVSTTDHSKVVSTPIVPAAATRGFDGASFVGGIILTMGLIAVGYLGFKYYKNHTERNYHTL